MRERVSEVSEEEYVERIRAGIQRYGRWRPWLLALHSASVIFWIVGCFVLDHFIRNVFGVNVGNRLLLILCVGWGIAIGLHMGYAVHAIFELLRGERTEQLLIKYYDLTRGQTMIPPNDGPSINHKRSTINP